MWPTLAKVDCPNPLKISAMPQMPKLMINTPITTAIIVLPSQFDEALRIPRSMGPTCLAGGNRDQAGTLTSAGQASPVDGCIIKWRPQPRNLGLAPIEARASAISGTGGAALLALAPT